MATENRQSQLRRGLPALLFVLLSLTLGTCPLWGADINPSRYELFAGDKFYLLTETTFSSSEESKVRLEIANSKSTVEAYHGVDVRIYSVPKPLEFLKRQKNLHRPTIAGNYQGEGLHNVVSYVFDTWYKKSRLAWQKIFSFFVRKKTVEQAPDLKQQPPHTYHTEFENNPQFGRLNGFELVDSFRYPIWEADPIAPPKGTMLQGSSSNFLPSGEGNVYIPLGKRNPGLYLVEAIIGSFRATTFLFVSDSVAITKMSGKQQLVWTVNKATGRAVRGSRVLFTDGVGTVGQGTTGPDGIYVQEGKRFERGYLLGTDPQGGVFISENYYYDSEILGTKVYLFTDRPLYRPGDTVNVKLLGRDFQGSMKSTGIAANTAVLKVVDAGGTVLFNQTFPVEAGVEGGATSFRLPFEATAGGYSLEVSYRNAVYVGTFRVANYVKPHFEVDIAFQKRIYLLKDTIQGLVKLTYPTGKPVENGKFELEIRKQRMTIVEGDYQYLDRFPVQVSKSEGAVDKDGSAQFDLPAATEPTRYLISVRAVDKASYRVAVTTELLVQAAVSPLNLTTERQFSAPKESVTFTFSPEEGQVAVSQPVAWEAIRLQDQSRTSGAIGGSPGQFNVVFEKAGSYSLLIKDRRGDVVGSANHWVQGPELANIPGTITILTDKNEYEIGSRASVLVTFSQKVEDALMTLEKDKVESRGLLSEDRNWVSVKRLSDREYRLELPVTELFAPNITLSVVYVSQGRYVFQNKGLKIALPQIQVSLSPERPDYAPGETVKVAVQTNWKGKPIASAVSVGVVDEMIYVLQPEIAPDISSFFYHLRRNQVRTASSLSFHSYDVASSAAGVKASDPSQYPQRTLKMHEQPRREEKDTAYWNPSLKTDESGRASFTFVMPDSVARWRITGRAISAGGQVGQKTNWVASKKDFYLKWVGPRNFRSGDVPSVSVAAFNLGSVVTDAVLEISGIGANSQLPLSLRPGANYVKIPVSASTDGLVQLAIRASGKVVDRLEVPVRIQAKGWVHTQSLPLIANANDYQIPQGAFNVRLSASMTETETFLRAVDYLAEYPYGCVEQTSSRLLPLAMAYSIVNSAGTSPGVRDRLQQRVLTERLRLVKMAGPQARFSWWGEREHSAFLTTYAYYADWVASKSLGIHLPAAHWESVLTAFRDATQSESTLSKVLMLWMFQEMKLPVKTLIEGISSNVATLSIAKAAKLETPEQSRLFNANETDIGDAIAIVLFDQVVHRENLKNVATPPAGVEEAIAKLKGSKDPTGQSVYLLTKAGRPLSEEDRIILSGALELLSIDLSTIDRALSLRFLQIAAGLSLEKERSLPVDLGSDWQRIGEGAVAMWQYRGKGRKFQLPALLREAKGVSLHLLYDSYSVGKSTLPVKLSRKLYRLVQQSDPMDFVAAPIEGPWEINSTDIYLDELTVAPDMGAIVDFALLEAALPPGAQVEETTWGLRVMKQDVEVEIGDPSFQAGDRSYSIALRRLSQPNYFYHLVRFSQPGAFEIPPTRLFQMYNPARKALEGGMNPISRKLVIR